MIDLWLIIMAVGNTMLLFVLYKLLAVKPIEENRLFTFQFVDVLDFCTHFTRDFLLSLIISRFMFVFGLTELNVLLTLVVVHVVADILVSVHYVNRS